MRRFCSDVALKNVGAIMVQEQSIFIEALEKEDPVLRAEFLDRVCADPNLRQRIERLLKRHEQEQSFLESPVPNLLETIDHPEGEPLGTVIGTYKLMERIGEGGFGLV